MRYGGDQVIPDYVFDPLAPRSASIRPEQVAGPSGSYRRLGSEPDPKILGIGLPLVIAVLG